MIVFLAHQAWLMGDAIVRTLVRLTMTRRRLLEWVPAAHAAFGPRPRAFGASIGAWRGRLIIGAAAIAVACMLGAAGPGRWPRRSQAPGSPLRPSPFGRACRPGSSGRRPLAEADAHRLRLVARRTWRFFETFVTAADNSLPPDNFQEAPEPVVGPSHVADQHRPLPAVGRMRAGLRLDRDARGRGAAGGDAGDHGSHGQAPRPFLQLVRHARPASARSAIRILGRQREPGRTPDRAGQRMP